MANIIGIYISVFLLLSCAAKIITDPVLVQREVVSFNMAIQSKNFDQALELLVAEERNEIMNTDGEVKSQYQSGMMRLNLSTLKNKKLILVDGKIKGMLNVLEEANRSGIISEEQRQLKSTIEFNSSSVLASSSQMMISSSSFDETVIESESKIEVPVQQSIVKEEVVAEQVEMKTTLLEAAPIQKEKITESPEVLVPDVESPTVEEPNTPKAKEVEMDLEDDLDNEELSESE